MPEGPTPEFRFQDLPPPAESWSEEELAQKRGKAATYWSTPEAQTWKEETDRLIESGDYTPSSPEAVDQVYQRHLLNQ